MSLIYLESGASGCRRACETAGVAVMVDALRASTTIPMLFQHGLRRLLVVAEVEDARTLAEMMPGTLLVGERGGQRLPGFDLGNSPLEIAQFAELPGKTAIFTSSNGAQRLTACQQAEHIFVASLCNSTALQKCLYHYAQYRNLNVIFISAGKFPDEEYISLEDDASSVFLASSIGWPIASESAAHYQYWQSAIIQEGLSAIFHRSAHAKLLDEIGFADDVEFCSRENTINTLPTVTGPIMLGNRQVGVELRDSLLILT